MIVVLPISMMVFDFGRCRVALKEEERKDICENKIEEGTGKSLALLAL